MDKKNIKSAIQFIENRLKRNILEYGERQTLHIALNVLKEKELIVARRAMTKEELDEYIVENRPVYLISRKIHPTHTEKYEGWVLFTEVIENGKRYRIQTIGSPVNLYLQVDEFNKNYWTYRTLPTPPESKITDKFKTSALSVQALRNIDSGVVFFVQKDEIHEKRINWWGDEEWLLRRHGRFIDSFGHVFRDEELPYDTYGTVWCCFESKRPE